MEKYKEMFWKLNGNKNISAADSKKRMEESRDIFRKINADLQQEGIAAKYVKLNIIYNMSMNLAVAFLILLIVSLGFEVQFFWGGNYELINQSAFLTIMLLGGYITFRSRGKKYHIYWVRNMVDAYRAKIEKE